MNETQHITFEYYGEPFKLSVTELSESHCTGFLEWDEPSRTRYMTLYEQHEEDEEWYLDEDGNRLEDSLLFEKSPCSITVNGTKTKAVKRYTNGENGEIWLSLQPWVRLSPL